ncbi:MAG TPA: hypothetical protein VFL91_07125 [Thermomicrobiales bacterium]|nr:hypothetical protein [Thermomicrobiales bacterium]
MSGEERGLTSEIGPLEIEWPLTIGYYGGIALAVAAGVIEPPLAIFIAAVPLFKMLNRPDASRPTRIVSQVLAGMAKPVGGDSPAAVRLQPSPARAARKGVVGEARDLAERRRGAGAKAAG